MLLGAEVLVETVAVEAQIYQNGVRLVHGNHLNSGVIELQVRLCEDLLQSLDKSSERCGLNCFDLEKISVCVCVSTCCERHPSAYYLLRRRFALDLVFPRFLRTWLLGCWVVGLLGCWVVGLLYTRKI